MIEGKITLTVYAGTNQAKRVDITLSPESAACPLMGRSL